MAKKKPPEPEEPEPEEAGRALRNRPVGAVFTPEEHELIRTAAFHTRKSMARFVCDAALDAARKVIAEREKKK